MVALPVGETSLEKLRPTMDEEIGKIKTDLISERVMKRSKINLKCNSFKAILESKVLQ